MFRMQKKKRGREVGGEEEEGAREGERDTEGKEEG